MSPILIFFFLFRFAVLMFTFYAIDQIVECVVQAERH